MLSVYLDQNVFGHILDHGQDWRQHPLVTLLEESPDKAAVYVSPTHVLELSLCSDHTRRQQLAEIMLHLCGAKRIWSGSDFCLVHSFGLFLDSFVPGAYNPSLFVSKYEQNAVKLCQGHLALFAACRDIALGTGGEYLEFLKAQTELIQARIAADPDHSIAKIIEQAKSLETTQDPDPLRMEGMTLEEIKAEVTAQRQKAVRPTRAQLRNLMKHRAQICRAYGTMDIGIAIDAVFRARFYRDLELTFDAPAIAAGWAKIMQETGCHGLPRDVATATGDELRFDRTYVLAVLNHAFQAAAQAGLPAASAGYYSTLRELERNLNQRLPPKGSVAFDASHATACTRFGVFFCADRILHESMRTFTKQLAEDFPELPIAEVIRTSDELKALLRRPSRDNG